MICDQCGQEFGSAGAEYDTHCVQTGFVGNCGAKTELHRMCLCPECARSRRGTSRFVIRVIVALVAVMLLVGLLNVWLR